MRIDSQLLKRYLNGEEKEGDKEIISDWFSDLQAEVFLRREYKLFWDEISQELDIYGYDGSMILNTIYHRIKLDESREGTGKKLRTRIVNIISRVAAVLLIPVVVSIIIYKNDIIPRTKEIAYSEIYSPLGTRTQFYLPDGSNGWLNGGSYLEFPISFIGKKREVVLRGEAYFDVVPNPKKPFTVSGDNIEVVAHGTAFNVEAYPDEDIIRITLVEGNIDIMGRKDARSRNISITEPGFMCSYDLKTLIYKTEKIDLDKIISWKEGRLICRDEPFDESVRKMNRWYNVKMIIKDKELESYTYRAIFEDETLDEVLKLLKLSAPIDYKDLGRKVRKDGTFEKRIIELYYYP
jgi:ferric-dicitrate binding protein FerR (iron transport regulator)